MGVCAAQGAGVAPLWQASTPQQACPSVFARQGSTPQHDQGRPSSPPLHGLGAEPQDALQRRRLEARPQAGHAALHRQQRLARTQRQGACQVSAGRQGVGAGPECWPSECTPRPSPGDAWG